jgi:hypothetical protein
MEHGWGIDEDLFGDLPDYLTTTFSPQQSTSEPSPPPSPPPGSPPPFSLSVSCETCKKKTNGLSELYAFRGCLICESCFEDDNVIRSIMQRKKFFDEIDKFQTSHLNQEQIQRLKDSLTAMVFGTLTCSTSYL